MSCEEVRKGLDDYVDGEVSEHDLNEIELHLAGCEACRRQERELRRLLALAAGLPRSVAPSRDLWPAIATGVRQQPSKVPAVGWWLGAVAAGLAAVALWLGTGPLRPTGPETAGRGMTSPTAGRAIAVGQSTSEVSAAERTYVRAATELMAALEARRSTLPPETLNRLDENLRTIDKALTEIREALHDDPKSPQLNRLLASTHEKKVDTLERVLRLASL